MKKLGITVAGVMSGTSADGINVALVRIDSGPKKSKKPSLTFDLLGHIERSYPRQVRAAILSAMNASAASVADLARLNFLLGELYANAVVDAQRKFRVKVNLVGCHGQTLYHQGEPANFLGRRVGATWQTGEAAIIAARIGVPVVSDLRPADMAVGGKGAPLVPFFDFMLFRDARVGRIVQNIGGIANLTAIPAGASAENVIAFDTGPGNMVIDGLMQKLFGRQFDRGGKVAASGKVLTDVVKKLLRGMFFSQKPPKTAGREEFGCEFVGEFLRACGRCEREDAVATATALTANSIAGAVGKFVMRRPGFAGKSPAEMIVSGGGTKNSTLLRMLTEELIPLNVRVKLSDEFGLPSAAKEAVAFALMAHETWHCRPSNIPSATGAKRAVVLGKISYP